jgi:uncharacterized membrane protein
MIFGIYLIGCVLSYLCVKKAFKLGLKEEWTTSMRNVTILISLGSYCGVVAGLIVILVVNSVNNDRKASW